MADPKRDDATPEGFGDLGAAWRDADLGSDAFADVDLERVRSRAEAFSRKIRRRNAAEILASLFVLGWAALTAARATSPLGLAAGASLGLGVVVVAAVLLRRGRPGVQPRPEAPTRAVLAFHRGELERQARLLHGAWLWYVGPLVPGVVLVLANAYAESVRANPGRAGAAAVVTGGVLALSFAVLGGVAWINRRAASRLRAQAREIAED